MLVRYLKVAQLEFHDAIAYYENEQANLGIRFKTNIQEAIERIKISPKLYPVVGYDVRKCTLHKIPFNILYALKQDHILIIAIAHHHRKPDYWVERVVL
jgi:plasmid stabilization system protein ParE